MILSSKKIKQRKVSSMINSIRYFEEKSISKFEEMENEFIKKPENIAEFVIGLTQELHNIGLRMIQEALENLDDEIRNNLYRKSRWNIVTRDEKELITSLGNLTYKKTLYKNKNTGKSEYLIDKIMKLDKHERMTPDAVTRLLIEAVQTSYRRGGIECSLESQVSKQTTKNKLHELKFPKPEIPVTKKEVEYLYIDADEDHVSLQFHEKKGDLIENEKHQKNNCHIAKIVYVYEGIEPESPQSKRHRLINPYYFCDAEKEKTNEEFWDEIYKYMDSHYELSKVKKIYLNADGGAWIKAGVKKMADVTYVLDEFHLEKYLTKLSSHMLDSKEDAKTELRNIIQKGTKEEFHSKVEELKEYSNGNSKKIDEAEQYILSNWTPAKIRLNRKDGVKGCSAEGHVSHVLSARMSSRPMGWSINGAAKMAELRAYYLNKRNIYDLVKYQKEALPKAAGQEDEEIVLTSAQILTSERNRHGDLGKYLESISHSIPSSSKKIVSIGLHLRNL